MTVTIRPMTVADAMAIERQPSQRIQLGLEAHMTPEAAQDLAENGEAWAAERDGRIVAIMGIREVHAGRQGIAWAVLAEGVGRAHIAITRFARRRIRESALVRIDAVARAEVHAECEWARVVGMTAAHVLRKFGALSETHVLFERIR